MEDKKKVCLVGYKTGISEAQGWVYGYTFSELKECCDQFRNWFCYTGNNKVASFNGDHAPYSEEKNGFNLVTRGGELQIELWLSRDKNDCTPKVGQICFCPFCGAKIEIKETCVVRLKSKYKSVFDGYEEQKVGGK